MAVNIFKKCSELDEIVHIQVFGVAESKSAIKFSNFRMPDPIWRTEIRKIREKFNEIVHHYVFGFAKSECGIRFSEFKMAVKI